ncbi:MAG: type II secretion system GspH family protein [Candidatus Gastranaerophilales bacterium]|nr:type II secretion system GspH family protein [Candidatus Gastranaerophilales bacterium]
MLKNLFVTNIKKAFTLTEVLTTLMVIGVIAAMTMPTLMTNVTEQKNLAMLKKLYSSYTVNIQSMLNSEYGTHCDSLSCLRKWGSATTPDYQPPYHNGALADTKYFNVDQQCTNDSDCVSDYFKNDTTLVRGRVTYTAASKHLTGTVYRLRNSASAIIYDYNDNCGGQAGDAGNNIRVCSIIIFDTNGFSGTNSPCQDRFGFYVANTPYSYNRDDAHGYKTAPTFLVPIGFNKPTGEAKDALDCTAEIMAKGWKKR